MGGRTNGQNAPISKRTREIWLRANIGEDSSELAKSNIQGGHIIVAKVPVSQEDSHCDGGSIPMAKVWVYMEDVY